MIPRELPAFDSKVFARDQRIYVGFNANQLPPVPTAPGHMSFEDAEVELWEFTSLTWTTPRYPYAPFAPAGRSVFLFTGPMFGVLEVFRKSVPLDRIQHRHHSDWQLAAHLRKSWNDLENSLKATIAFFAGKKRVDFLEMTRFPSPSHFGYNDVHVTDSRTRAAIMRSRDAFRPMMALCSYYIAFQLRRNEILPDYPQWARDMNDGGFHPQWVQGLIDSVVGNFRTTQRVGAFVSLSCPCIREIEVYINARVPIFIDYREGSPTWRQDGGFLKNYTPRPTPSPGCLRLMRLVSFPSLLLRSPGLRMSFLLLPNLCLSPIVSPVRSLVRR
ncbi:hypothetical protein A0H81_10360 [Grifola frondosa]|uniref:Uncharacterized protein n=1 Tax=Grifola frondosa TaxID=5627 RepID=A0A1C7LYK7_GRIFR|nr:hypothetical protein A0H81_10360 [Grifola frondosa]